MPKVSVVMGAYNIGALAVFDRSMQSILDQTMTDFEIIICDDGSTDDTYARLTAYAEYDERIRLIRQERNAGLAVALNRCIGEAAGEYICRHDADDISVADRFEKQLRFLHDWPNIGFVGSNVLLYDGDGRWGRRVFPEFPEKKDFLFTMPYVHGALMFRREVLVEAGGYRTDKGAYRVEDYELLMRLYARGVRGANIQEYLYEFLEDDASFRRRKYRYRINEARVRRKGFSDLGLMPGAVPYVIKPLVVGLLPKRWLDRLRRGRTLQRDTAKR